MDSARHAMLNAFARLFIKTANKLQIPYTQAELSAAVEHFGERMAKVLDVLAEAPDDFLPREAQELMEAAINDLSPTQVVGQIAALPLIQHSQMLLQHLARRAAEQRLLEHALAQADSTYGGN